MIVYYITEEFRSNSAFMNLKTDKLFSKKQIENNKNKIFSKNLMKKLKSLIRNLQSFKTKEKHYISTIQSKGKNKNQYLQRNFIKILNSELQKERSKVNKKINYLVLILMFVKKL